MGGTGTIMAAEQGRRCAAPQPSSRVRTHSYRYVQVSAAVETDRLRAELVSNSAVTAVAWVEGVDQLMPLAMAWSASDIRWV